MPTDAAPRTVMLMSLRHVGEEDAALPRIDITTTAPPAPAGRLVAVQVTPAIYQSLCQIAAGAPPAMRPTWRTGSFELNATGCTGAATLPSHIEPETFLRMVDLIQARAQMPGATMASVQGIANIVRSANRMH